METKDQTEPKAAIIGIAISPGSFLIKTEEKAKTVVRDADPSYTAIVDAYRLGLKADSTWTFAGNEGPLTAAINSSLYAVLMYDINLSYVTYLALPTESTSDISENQAIKLQEALSEASEKLEKKGIELGNIAPLFAIQLQSACESAGKMVALLANMGTPYVEHVGSNGVALVVGSDDAKYRYGTSEDLTGGAGSVTVLVGEASSDKALFLLNPNVSSYRKAVPDFIKPILKDLLPEEEGLAFINTSPVVAGTYSEYAYMLGTYKALKSFFNGSEPVLNDLYSFAKSYMIMPHIPYPSMPDKMIAYLIRHAMRNNSELAAKVNAEISEAIKNDEKLRKAVKKEMGGEFKEPFLGKFDHFESEFEFILDVERPYVLLESYAESIKRLEKAYPEKALVAKERIRENSHDIALQIIANLENAKEKYARYLDDKLSGYIDGAIGKLSEIGERWGSPEEMMLAMGNYAENKNDASNANTGLIGYMRNFEENMDSAFNKAVRRTATFKELRELFDVDSIIALSRRSGNLYTSSTFECIISYFSGASMRDEEYEQRMGEKLKDLIGSGKKILEVHYGSGMDIDVIELTPVKNLQRLMNFSEKLRRNILMTIPGNEHSAITEITEKEYTAIRRHSDVVNSNTQPASVVGPFVHIDDNKLLEMRSTLRGQKVKEVIMH